YVDTNNLMGLSPGSKYCYRLVATFPPLLGGLSIASEEACDNLMIDIPVITNVDIVSTSETEGQVRVTWTPPYEIDEDVFPPAYTYELIRTEGPGPGGTFTSITNTMDTTFLDTSLNTEDLMYSYRIVLRDATNAIVDTSQQASTVRLLPSSQIGAIVLNWNANVPWSNIVQEFPYHRIYRDNVINTDPTALQLIDSVDVTLEGLAYLDDGRFNGLELDEEIEYCYFVTTRGSYGNDSIPEPLVNNSQIICAQPSDSIPPCTPLAFSFSSDNNFDCEAQFSCEDDAQELSNILTWESDNAPECDDDIAFFRIYVSRPSEIESFVVLGETTENEFIHDEDIFDRNLPLNSLAFCYYITAVDRSGNESQISEIICNDNCPQYILPNVFTPNDDGVNDTFVPIQRDGQCPRFVESVLFKVFNRAGVELFSYDSNQSERGEGGAFSGNTVLINWDGKTDGGEELPSGVYFYSAEVDFITLNSNDKIQVLKGWIQVIK
ncbi:MAG: gliding motility-associated C-terminal domain-containing protein, partial [Bacteroidota bacterium]